MTVVRLFCANGFSTAMMCQKIQEAATKGGKQYDVTAFPYSNISTEGAKADVIVLGPQIRYNLRKAQKLFPDKPVFVLDAAVYGQMNGAKAFESIEKALGAS